MKMSLFTSILFFAFTPVVSFCQLPRRSNETYGQFVAKQKADKLIKERNESNKDTLLKTKKAAIEFAEPILFKTYGKAMIKKERPYKTNLVGEIWEIEGTLKEGYDGGVFLIKINAIDGKVVEMIHGK